MRKWLCMGILAALLMALALGAVADTEYRTSITPTELVAFLKADMAAHQTDYGSFNCFDHVREVFVKMGFRPMVKKKSTFNSITYWNQLISEGRANVGSTDIPVGADVFFDSASNGMMGIYIGNNKFIIDSDKVVEKSLKDNYYKPKYIGWAWHDNVVVLDGTEGAVEIDEVSFPDPTFRQYVRDLADTDHNGYLFPNEMDAVSVMDCSSRNIASLSGIENFTQLQVLNCSDNALTSLDVSMNPFLTELDCGYNALTSLDVSMNPNLALLFCGGNELTELDISQNVSLVELNCSGNELTALNISNNAALEELDCSENRLAELLFPESSKLNTVICSENALLELDLDNCAELARLSCGNNLLTALDVTNNPNLQEINCALCSIASIDVSNCPELTTLECADNALTTLDVSQNPELSCLFCNNNNISRLDIRNNPILCERYFVYSNDGEGLAFDDGVKLVMNPFALDDENFPDENFRAVVAGFDKNSDGNLSLTELNAVKAIDCSFRGIESLEGIQYFVNLTTLNCEGNLLTSIPIEYNYRMELKALNCGDNDLSEEGLSSFPLSTLEELYCSNDHLQELGLFFNDNLRVLHCDQNGLEALDVSELPALAELDCSDNDLVALDLDANAKLEKLICDSNALSSLNVSANPELTYLNCDDNDLVALDVSLNPKLKTLSASGNGLVTLDVSQNAALEMLGCDRNSLAYLDVTGNPALEALSCCGNDIDVLDLSQCRDLVEKYLLTSRFNVDQELNIASCPESPEDSLTKGVRIDVGVDLVLDDREDLTTMTLPPALTSISSEAFSGIAADIVVVPEGCTAIDAKAFANCPNLSKIYLPDTVTAIADSAFDNSYRVRFVTDSEDLKTWGLNHGILWLDET